MKQSITFSGFVDSFRAHGRYDQFGYEGLRILFDYFEEYEESTGNDMELDVIAICCEYSIESFDDIASNCSIDLSGIDDDDDKKNAVIEYINEKSTVIGDCADGIVYVQF